ncbi:MAG: HD domain-containing protein [Desulfovibrio sp.]|jgi:HD superfamily phosphohydrolase YqeK|nr:HD domain-containing protein [Desulfovibrio sp.]
MRNSKSVHLDIPSETEPDEWDTCRVTARDHADGIASHKRWYLSYADGFRNECTIDAAPLDLKRDHTLSVLEKARRIADEEGFAPPLARACLLAALYHDVARFAQYIRYRTFKDRESCNHAHLGMKILKREGRMEGEDPRLARLVLSGVCLHNRFALPPGLPEEIAAVAKVVRDADKLDILRVMHAHLERKPYNPTVVLSLGDDPGMFGEAVVRAVMEGRVASYGDLTCVNDMRLLLGTWLFDMNFPSSRRQFREDGHATAILADLPDRPPYLEPRRRLLACLDGA